MVDGAAHIVRKLLEPTIRRPPIASRATRRCRTKIIIASISSSPPAGSRCASSTTRSRRSGTSPRSAKACSNPISLARGLYWQGRAAEASGRMAEARAAIMNPRRAIRRRIMDSSRGRGSAATIWRCAVRRRRAPRSGCRCRMSPSCAPSNCFTRPANATSSFRFSSDLADKGSDTGILALIGEIAARQNDARAMLLLGKTALSRGIASITLPSRRSACRNSPRSARAIDRSVVFAIARQESHSTRAPLVGPSAWA